MRSQLGLGRAHRQAADIDAARRPRELRVEQRVAGLHGRRAGAVVVERGAQARVLGLEVADAALEGAHVVWQGLLLLRQRRQGRQGWPAPFVVGHRSSSSDGVAVALVLLLLLQEKRLLLVVVVVALALRGQGRGGGLRLRGDLRLRRGDGGDSGRRRRRRARAAAPPAAAAPSSAGGGAAAAVAVDRVVVAAAAAGREELGGRAGGGVGAAGARVASAGAPPRARDGGQGPRLLVGRVRERGSPGAAAAAAGGALRGSLAPAPLPRAAARCRPVAGARGASAAAALVAASAAVVVGGGSGAVGGSLPRAPGGVGGGA